jgi:hypothetical protein
MIIVWTGRGILAMLIMLACFLLPLIGALVLTEAYRNLPVVIIPLALVGGWSLGGVLCWRLGRSWNRHAAPGEYHTLYFVRVEYWGVICLMLAGALGAFMVVAKIIAFFP